MFIQPSLNNIKSCDSLCNSIARRNNLTGLDELLPDVASTIFFIYISLITKDKEAVAANVERSKSDNCLKEMVNVNSFNSVDISEEITPPPIPPLPTNYQRSDGLFTSIKSRF